MYKCDEHGVEMCKDIVHSTASNNYKLLRKQTEFVALDPSKNILSDFQIIPE